MVKLNIDLPDSFFLEEERDGYLVSAKTKELWAVQLDLLIEFDRVCKKHNLRYILDFGSLLGAVRHKGFIPWDEDIDVSMLREDYDKLMEIGPQEFKHPYFLQNYKTEKRYRISVTRFRRSDTAFFQPDDIIHQSDCNQGIFIDIFVFDDIPSNDRNEILLIHKECQKYHNAVLSLENYHTIHSSGLISALLSLRYMFYKLRYGSGYRAFKKMDMISKQFHNKEYVSCLFTRIAMRCRRKEWLESIIYVPFESFEVPIPAAYDEVLKECYGDYKTPVIDTTPKVWFFDADQSYKELIRQDGFYDKLLRDLSINPSDFVISGKEIKTLLREKIKRVLGLHS